MRNYILVYLSIEGKQKGVAVSVKTNGEVHTYFIQSQKDLNKFRKGERIYKE